MPAAERLAASACVTRRSWTFHRIEYRTRQYQQWISKRSCGDSTRGRAMTHVNHIPAPTSLLMARKLDVAAWGLFFVWVGFALLADVGWGFGLLGIGLITLGAQMSRKLFGLAVEAFWMVVGLLFVVGGILELLSVRISLMPFVLIIAGLALLVAAVRGERRSA
jgi:hypothetical protein